MADYFCGYCKQSLSSRETERCPHCTSYLNEGGGYYSGVGQILTDEEIKQKIAFELSPERVADRAQIKSKQEFDKMVLSGAATLQLAAIACWIYGYINFVSGFGAIWCILILFIAGWLFFFSIIAPKGEEGAVSFLVGFLAVLMLYMFIGHFVPAIKIKYLEFFSPFSDAPVTSSNALPKDDSRTRLVEKQQTDKPPVAVV